MTNLKHDLQAQWKKTIRKRPLAERLSWLNSPDGMIAFDARQRWQKIRQIRSQINKLISEVPSIDWLLAAENRGETFPVKGMILSHGKVRIGEDHVPTRRFTSPAAVAVEDLLDQMDVLRAIVYRHPPSITGLQMELIAWRRGREEKQRMGNSRRTRQQRNKGGFSTSRGLDITYSEKGLKLVAPGRSRSVGT